MMTWNPVREIQRMQNEMTGLFSGLSGAVHEYPALNVWINEDGAVLQAELPGIEAADLNITVNADTVTLSGARKPLELHKNDVLHRQERLQGDFNRSLRLPFHVNGEAVAASMNKGILSVRLPRAEEDKPRKIEIKPE